MHRAPGMKKPLGPEEHGRFIDWIETGIKHGWIASPVCSMHEPLPLTAAEETELDDGHDPCLVAIRVWAE